MGDRVQVIIEGVLLPGTTEDMVKKAEVMGLAESNIISCINLDATMAYKQRKKRRKDNLINWCFDQVKIFTMFTPEQVKAKGRKAELVAIRWCIIARLLHSNEFSLAEIGRLLGDRDHTTIMYARDQFRKVRGNNHLDYYKTIFNKHQIVK